MILAPLGLSKCAETVKSTLPCSVSEIPTHGRAKEDDVLLIRWLHHSKERGVQTVVHCHDTVTVVVDQLSASGQLIPLVIAATPHLLAPLT